MPQQLGKVCPFDCANVTILRIYETAEDIGVGEIALPKRNVVMLDGKERASHAEAAEVKSSTR